jgi:hypothetical protein
MEQMNITSAQYIQNSNLEVVCVDATIDGIIMSVPLDPANRHYAEIMRQVDEGIITIQDADSN